MGGGGCCCAWYNCWPPKSRFGRSTVLCIGFVFRLHGGQGAQGIYSRPGGGHYRGEQSNELNAASTTWDSHAHRSPSHSARGGYPLAYSMNTHGGGNHNGYGGNGEDHDHSSPAHSFPSTTAASRSSAPASPILTYSLPRQGQSGASLSLRNTNGNDLSPYGGNLYSKIHCKDDEGTRTLEKSVIL